MNDVDVDVVVVGAGGGGLAAALAASDAGASVVVFEKSDSPGGNTALSTGSIPAAGSKLQKAAGVQDSPERMVADLLRQSGPHENEEVLRQLAESSAELIDWLTESHNVSLSLVTDYKHVGHTVHRLHAPESRRGADLTDDLVAACRAANIDVITNSPVSSLLVEDGCVEGVVISGERVETQQIRARAVILASNGFGANPALIRTWLPEAMGTEYFGAHGSTGEGIEWGLELGGHLANATAYQGYAAVAYPHGSILSWTTIEMGGIIIDSTGNRLGDESVGYSGFTTRIIKGVAPFYVLCDERIRDLACRESEYAELVDMGGVRSYASAADLAEALGIPVHSLERTLAEYQSAAAGDSADPFQRRDFGIAPLQSPLMVSRVVPGIFHTQGGLAVDTEGRVLGAGDRPIQGLFAVGGVAAGVSGATGADGYSSGNGLLSAIGLGRIAGRAAVSA
jgi:fumarate reductase flavoprotein subunit